MQAYAEGFDLFDKCEYELDNAKIAHLWGQGSVVRSWLCELAARAFEADGNDLAALEGYTADSGEGRWTIEDATAHDVPTPVITASLYARFRSRGNGDFADRMLAALRNQFGGHAVKSAPRAARRRADAGGAEWRSRGSPTAEPENPLTTGLERMPVAPTTLVIFGATGDLAQAQTHPRAVQPRARGRAARALPPRRRLAQGNEHERLPRGVRAGDPRASRGARPTRTCSRACSTTSSTCRERSTTPTSTRSSARCSTASRRRPASRSTAPSTCRRRRASSPSSSSSSASAASPATTTARCA